MSWDRKRDDEVEIKGELVNDTPKAYLIGLPTGTDVWVPKSQVTYDDADTFFVPRWLFDKNEDLQEAHREQLDGLSGDIHRDRSNDEEDGIPF